ncbi:uncharacterized protein Triagg1_2014 [Trichoderma aggressivum f. europaeum]|uniref:Uncharacterized protein n=1 Tax=Trichoderma aggressivum f. europaeum TaxID=173218 RepID=A0AAE1M1V3_9HYPO|nr:hypothetical protein Triagg1_2014 [Trichoderma aggressivum f. europaeum]
MQTPRPLDRPVGVDRNETYMAQARHVSDMHTASSSLADDTRLWLMPLPKRATWETWDMGAWRERDLKGAMWPPTTATPLGAGNDGDDDDDDNDGTTTAATAATTTALGLGQRDRPSKMGGGGQCGRLATYLLVLRLSLDVHPVQYAANCARRLAWQRRRVLAAGRLQEPWQPFIFNGEAKRRPQTLGRPTACWGFVMLGLPGTDAVASPRAQSPPRPARPGSDEIP